MDVTVPQNLAPMMLLALSAQVIMTINVNALARTLLETSVRTNLATPALVFTAVTVTPDLMGIEYVYA